MPKSQLASFHGLASLPGRTPADLSHPAARLAACLGMPQDAALPVDIHEEQTWEADGVHGTLLSWSVGYGPRTQAFRLRPANGRAKAAIMALHDHSGFKFFGKEKIADGPGPAHPSVEALRQKAYGGRAFANEWARQGFDIFVPDTFLWGSRRFELDDMPEGDLIAGRALAKAMGVADDPVRAYNAISIIHEHTVEKALRLFGTCLAGVVNYEDRIALRVFRSLSPPDLPIASVGLSGGGLRSALLSATSDDLSACVVVGMMATYESLIHGELDQHTWMLYPPGWSLFADFPDIAGLRAPRPLLVQYDRHDCLFSLEGMTAAHRHLEQLYRDAPESYSGLFYDGDHKFDTAMQDDAFDWLANVL